MADDYVVCRICGAKKRRLDGGHIQKTHGVSSEEYKKLYPDAPTKCEEYLKSISESVKRLHADPNSVYRSEEYKAKKSASLRRMWRKRTPEERQAIKDKTTQALREYYAARPDLIQEYADRTKKQWADPESRQKLMSGLLASWTEERKEEASELWRSFHSDPSSPLGTEEWADRISETVSGLWEQQGPPYRTEQRSRKISEDSRRKWKEGCFDGVFASPTKPELSVKAMLDDLGLDYQYQCRIPTEDSVYIVDFFVESCLVVEVFGDYWHGPSKPEQQEKDKKRLHWFSENGYDMLVLWENEINERPTQCSKAIISRLENVL